MDPDEAEVLDSVRRRVRPGPGRLFGKGGARKFLVRAARFALGLPNRLDTPDRRILEDGILPWYAGREDIRSILFVGCGWYTSHYGKEYFAAKEFWTIDPSRFRARFGAARHVTASLEALDRHFPEGYFDLILCNGVFGFGLDGREECELAFERCRRHLREGGELVLGWDDVPERRPFPPEGLDSLKKLRRNDASCCKTWRCRTDTAYRHVFDFYVK
jgi:hypothetical protein